MDQFQIEFNNSVSELLVRRSGDGSLKGRVCVCCDRFIGPKDLHLISLNRFLKCVPYLTSSKNIPEVVRRCYIFQTGREQEDEQLRKALLSPRSEVVFKSQSKRAAPHVMVCDECHSGLNAKQLSRGNLPRFAIANDWAIGSAPACLRQLNEVELALISQVRTRGHLFTYWGGCHRSIKGWHTFYNADPNYTVAVTRGVGELTNASNIAVVLCGPFTREQKEKIRQKTQVNIPLIMEAYQWLKENNVLYENEPPPVIGEPTIIDQSTEVESEDTDIETREQVTVVFPDGSVNTGGSERGRTFEEVIAELQSISPGTIPYLCSRPAKEAIRDYEDDNLMRAFPLQFPYGIGLSEGLLREKVSLPATLRHLLYLSIPAFHEACFVLVIHNMFERGRALNGSIWRVMGRHELCRVTEEELNNAVKRKKQGLPPLKGPGDKFLSSIHAVKKNLAHSNEAAMAARSQFLSLTHHFGVPKVLFTVSFDDSLDIRILA